MDDAPHLPPYGPSRRGQLGLKFPAAKPDAPTPICPECGQSHVLRILYGHPTTRMLRNLGDDEILGGCIPGPEYQRPVCGWRGWAE